MIGIGNPGLTRASAPALLALALLVAPLGAPGRAQQPAPEPRAPDRTQVTLCMTLEPPGLDPTVNPAQAIREVTYANVFEGLMAIDGTGAVVPRLARAHEVSADGRVHRFTLREGVRFHDGQTLDAAAVKAAFERAMAPGSRTAQRWIFAPIETIDAVDAATLVIRLKAPAANFLYGLAWGDAVIPAPGDPDRHQTAPVGTGPYRLAAWRRGDRVVLEAHGDWWGGAVAIPRAVFRFIPDAQAQVAAIRAGDCDALPNLAAQEAVAALRREPGLTVTVGDSEGETLVALNHARAPLNDVRVRRALAHAIDRRQVIEGAVSGFGTPIGSHFSPRHPAHVDLTGRYPYDPARARALLAEAGVRPGTRLTLRLPPPPYARRSGEIVAAMLGQVGLQIAIEPMEFPHWLERVFRNKDFDLSIIAHTEPLDIGIYARDDYYFGYRSEAFRAVLARAEAATDAAARDAAYGEAQRLLAEDAVNVFLFMLPKITVARQGLTGLWTHWPLPANPLAELRWR